MVTTRQFSLVALARWYVPGFCLARRCSSSTKLSASKRKIITVDFTSKQSPFKKPLGLKQASPAPKRLSPVVEKENIEDRRTSEEQDGEAELTLPPAENEALQILQEKYVPPFLEGMKTRQLFGSNIHVRENAVSKVLVKKVEFIKSSSKESDCPQDGFPEFAMIGRSNVGKSSLINLLVERKKMALISKKPGKTQLINHFLVNKSWYLVDLPGYGYAIAPKTLCLKWNEFTKEYFLSRKTLAMVVLLIDSSILPTQIDLDCANWLLKHNVPMTLAFTKCDRRKGTSVVENVARFLLLLKRTYPHTPPWILTSCMSGQGRDELMLHLSEIRKYWHS